MGLKRSKDGTADPMQVVSRFLDAANHHDADALRACVHHDFESIQPIHPGRNFRGSGQLVSNWKAIFEAEPGFRLTVLRSVVEDDTVWVEVHGAGDSAEAAGIFIVGVEDGRIRWIRVYSDLVEPAPEVAPSEVVPAPAAEAAPAEKVALEPAAVAGGDGAVEVPETPPAVDDEPAAVVGEGDGAQEGRPLRLVSTDAELEAESVEDAGTATSLRLVGDEEPDGGDAAPDLEGSQTAAVLDAPTDETDETGEEGRGDEVDAGGAAPDDAAETGDAAAPHGDQGGDESTAEAEGEGVADGAERPAETPAETADGAGDGPVDGDASESEAEEVDASGATADATADGEPVDPPSQGTDAEADASAAAVEAPSGQAGADATADGEIVETPSDDPEADAALDAIADESPPDETDAPIAETTSGDAEVDTSNHEVGGNLEGDAEGDVDTSDDGASTTAAPLAGDTDGDRDASAGDRPGDEGVTPGAGEADSEPPASNPGRGALEVVEPTSPPLPRATAPAPSSMDEEQRSWRRMWRRKRGPTGS